MKKALVLLLVFLAACSPPASTGSQPLNTPTASLPFFPLASQPATGSTMACTILHSPVTPDASMAEQFKDKGHVSGPAEAPVKIIVFSDYQCPGCAYLGISLKQIRLTHPEKVQIIYLHVPLAGQDKDAAAVLAVEAADQQGRFWDMHDLLFEKLAEWSALSPADFETWTFEQAAALGMDRARFEADYRGETAASRLAQALQFTEGIQPFNPPMLFINSNSPYNSFVDFASLDTVVRLQALAGRQFSACPPWVIDPLKQYVATLHTAGGDIVIQLLPDKAPMAVNNFVYLASQGWYDGITFHRVLSNLAVTGDPSGTGMGNPGYYFATEIGNGLSFDRPGVVAMTNSGVDTNGSQFFITTAPAHSLDGTYTIFGTVLSGLEVLAGLRPRDPQPLTYLPPGDELISVSIAEK